jgi:hypothetical protein
VKCLFAIYAIATVYGAESPNRRSAEATSARCNGHRPAERLKRPSAASRLPESSFLRRQEIVKRRLWRGHSMSPQKRLGPHVGATLRRRAPLISSQRPCGVWTVLRRMASQLLHLSTTPIGAA